MHVVQTGLKTCFDYQYQFLFVDVWLSCHVVKYDLISRYDTGIFAAGDSDSKWTSLCSDSAILETNYTSEWT